MQKGFIFNYNRCVSCSACSAACLLENGWNIQPRKIFTYNIEAIPSLVLHNLSLACNHCETALCLDGCPTSAYRRDEITGAVVMDEDRCIGCKYCQWNCPYDAPKFDPRRRIIGKCNLCYSGLKEGLLPACTSACPTGALSYGELAENHKQNIFPWFPEKNLNPAIEVAGRNNSSPLRIIPGRVVKQEVAILADRDLIFKGEWSLVGFSFLSAISVSTIISSLIKGVFPNKFIFLSTIFFAATISLFHLGKPLRYWRSANNLRSSPLSREITLFILYSIISFISVIFHIPGFLVAAAIIGLVLLLLIDSVYIFSDKRKFMMIHSGQTFISGLLMVSFFSGIIIPFVFIAVIKSILLLKSLIVNKLTEGFPGLRFLRIALLIIAGASLISGISYPDPVIFLLFIIGELFDRIIFYYDFSPLHISNEINMQINKERYETKRG